MFGAKGASELHSPVPIVYFAALHFSQLRS